MKTEEIPFEVIKKDDPNLPAGQEKVVKAGVKGERTHYISVLTENGKTTETVLDSQVSKEAVNQVVEVGTLVTHVGDENGQAANAEDKPKLEIPSQPTRAKAEEQQLPATGSQGSEWLIATGLMATLTAYGLSKKKD